MSTSANPTSSGGGPLVADYIKEQVEREDARKESLEKRGIGVITTAGALVTLLFGLAALSTQASQTFELPSSAAVFLAISVVFFFGAALLGILTNVPLVVRGLRLEGVRAAVKSDWAQLEPDIRRNEALTNLDILESAKERNHVKAVLLFWAMGLEVLAVVMVGAAVGIVVAPLAFLITVGVGVLLVLLAYLKAYGLHTPTHGPLGDLLLAARATFRLVPPQEHPQLVVDTAPPAVDDPTKTAGA